MSSTDRWLAELQGVAKAVHTDRERGDFLLRVSSAVANLNHDNVADLVRLTLDSGAWRDYTYPNGDHFEFRSREFDYFLAQQDIDPRIVADAAIYTGDQELRVLLVESSLDKAGDDRRSLEDITAAYPGLAPWLEKYGLRTLGTSRMYKEPEAREAVKTGRAVTAKRWRFNVEVNGENITEQRKAEAIADKLRTSGLLAQVIDALGARDSVNISVNSATCDRCGTGFTSRRGTGRYCSDSCKTLAARERKKLRAV